MENITEQVITEVSPKVQNIVDLLNNLLKNEFGVTVSTNFLPLKEGLLGVTKPQKDGGFIIDMNIPFKLEGEGLNNMFLWYGVQTLETLFIHTLIHEYGHIFDIVNEVTTNYGAIRENGSEYFAEYFAWLVLTDDVELSKEYSEKYATFRQIFSTDESQKSIRCSVEVLHYMFFNKFQQIRILCNKK